MIQEINPGPTIAQAFGKGLLNTYEPMLQKELARQQTKRAIGDIKSRSTGASPQDLLFNLIEASTISPEIGRSLGPLYETLLRSSNAGNAPKALETALGLNGERSVSAPQSMAPPMQQPMQQPTQNQPQIAKAGFQSGTQLTPEDTAQKLSQQKSGQQVQDLSNKFLQQTRPDLFLPSAYGNIPTFDIQTKSQLRPQEEAQIRKNLNADNISPEQQEQVIAKINDDIKARYQEALKNYDILQGQQGEINKKWDKVQADAPILLDPFIGGFGPKTQQILKDKFNQYASSQPVNQTPQAIEAQAMTLLQRDLNQLNALSTLSAMPPVRSWGDVKSYMDATKKAYAPLKDEGWDQALLEDAINNKDMGIEEAHEAIYGDQTNKQTLQSIGNIKKGKDDQQYISNVAKQLKKLGPNDDLILARTMVLGNGGSIQDFVNALYLAQQEGLELSPFQKAQLQEIQIPRQQPLYEIFSPGKSSSPFFYIGGIPGAIFGHFFNYLRGKK